MMSWPMMWMMGKRRGAKASVKSVISPIPEFLIAENKREYWVLTRGAQKSRGYCISDADVRWTRTRIYCVGGRGCRRDGRGTGYLTRCEWPRVDAETVTSEPDGQKPRNDASSVGDTRKSERMVPKTPNGS